MVKCLSEIRSPNPLPKAKIMHVENRERSIARFLNSIFFGDCLRFLPELPDASVDLVARDPPYLVDYRTRDGQRAYPNDTNDVWLKPTFREIFRVLKPNSFCVSFYGWPSAELFLQAWKDVGFKPVAHLVWIKRYSSRTGFTRACHDCAYLLGKGHPDPPEHPPKDVFHWRWEGNTLHPAQRGFCDDGNN